MIEFFSKFRKQLLAIFDVEGVLYDGEYLPILAEKLNKEQALAVSVCKSSHEDISLFF